MNAGERRRLLEEVAHSANCSNPIRLSGETVNLATGEVTDATLRVACKDRRHVVCPACSYLYKADAWILVSAGLVGGKGVDPAVSSHPRLFVTLTAPSFGRVHTITDRGGCVSGQSSRRDGAETCPHGQATTCPIQHGEADPELGRPLCVECFDYEGAVLWNAHASRLWSVTVQRIRRGLAEEGGVSQSELSAHARLHYLKVAEMQRRGLVHVHALLRGDGPDASPSEPPGWLTATRVARVVRRAVRDATVTGFDGASRRWGRVLDVRDLASRPEDALKVSSYVAKYATKTTDGSRELARRFHSRQQVEGLIADPHARRLALTAWDLAGRPEYGSLNLRAHAHAFGFTGQLITKSRAYSTTFGALREARAAYMSARGDGDPLEGTFHYDGRGYDDPRARELAELFFTLQRELREESAFRRRASPEGAGGAL